MVNQRVQLWKEEFADKDKLFSITKEINHLITDCMQACVFGMDNRKKDFQIKQKGKETTISCGRYMRLSFYNLLSRSYWPSHLAFPVLNSIFLTPIEQEMHANDNRFK